MFNYFIKSKRVKGYIIFDSPPPPEPPVLIPPPDQDLLRSVSVAQITDLISEGPIYGLVDRFGNRTGDSSQKLKGVYFNDSPVLNNDDTFNFRKVIIDTREGQEIQSAFVDAEAFNVKVINKKLLGSFIDGGDATLGTGNTDIREKGDFSSWTAFVTDSPYFHVHYIDNSDVNEVIVSINISSLQNTITQGDAIGQNIESFIEFRIEYGIVGSVSPTIVDYRIDGRVTSSMKFDLGRNASFIDNQNPIILPSSTDGVPRYIKVSKLTGETISPLVSRECYLDSIIEIVNKKFSYPYSAMFYVEVDSRDQDDIPQRSYDVRGKLVNVPSNYRPIIESGIDVRYTNNPIYPTGQNHLLYSGDWDGNFYQAWTDNPAWILYDVLTNNVYGAGKYIDNDLINKWNLYSIGRYCDAVNESGYFVGMDDANGYKEPRFSCNLVVNSFQNAFEFLSNISTLFRGMTYHFAGGLDFADDRPRNSLVDFNNSNVKDGVFQYSSPDKNTIFTVAEVIYKDKDDNFQEKVEYVENSKGIRDFGYIKKNIEGYGITSRSMARRLGRYVIANSILEPELVSFEAGRDALFLRPGDVFTIHDELRTSELAYGRVLASGTSNGTGYLTLDRALDLNTTGIRVFNPSLQSQLKTLNDLGNSGIDVTNTQIEDLRKSQVLQYTISSISGNSAFVNSDFSNTQIGSSANLLISGQNSLQFRMIGMSELENGFYAINGIAYNANKYNLIDSGILVDSNEISTAPSTLLNRPNTPLNLVLNRSAFDLSGVFSITGDWNTPTTPPTISSYRVVLEDPQGIDETYHTSNTIYTITGLNLAGQYNMEVYSIGQSPQSLLSQNPVISQITIPPYTGNNSRDNFVITGFEFDRAISIDYSSGDSFGFGTGRYAGKDVNIAWSLLSPDDNILNNANSIASSPYYNYSKISILNANGTAVAGGTDIEDNYKNASYYFTSTLNEGIFGSLTRDFQIKVEVYDVFGGSTSGQLLCQNPAPVISGASLIDGVVNSGITNAIRFDVAYSGFDDIYALHLFSGLNSTFLPSSSNFVTEVSANPYSNTTTFYLTALNSIPTGQSLYYKISPVDDFGTGTAFNIGSGVLIEATIKSLRDEILTGNYFVTTTGDSQFASGNKYFYNSLTSNFRIGVKLPLEATGNIPSGIFSDYFIGANEISGYFPRDALHIGGSGHARFDGGNIYLNSGQIILTGLDSSILNSYFRGMLRHESNTQSFDNVLSLGLFSPSKQFLTCNSTGALKLTNPLYYNGLTYQIVNVGVNDFDVWDNNGAILDTLYFKDKQEYIYNGSSWTSQRNLSQNQASRKKIQIINNAYFESVDNDITTYVVDYTGSADFVLQEQSSSHLRMLHITKIKNGNLSIHTTGLDTFLNDASDTVIIDSGNSISFHCDSGVGWVKLN